MIDAMELRTMLGKLIEVTKDSCGCAPLGDQTVFAVVEQAEQLVADFDLACARRSADEMHRRLVECVPLHLR